MRKLAMSMPKKLALLAPLLALALPGCISIGSEPPEQLLTLTPSAMVPAGEVAEGNARTALAVMTPSVTQRLNVPRIPVSTSDSSLAYLADAHWVEKPAQLFRHVLVETIRAEGKRFVVQGGELEYAATTQLTGQLAEMGYDSLSGSVIVRYDAMLALPDGTIRTRRFEESVSGIAAEPAAVGEALNDAANAVAADVAEWVG